MAKKIIQKPNWFKLYSTELFAFIAYLIFAVLFYVGDKSVFGGYVFGSLFVVAFIYIQIRRGYIVIKPKGKK